MAQEKQKKEKEVPRVCVCGGAPCIVKHKSRYMVSCSTAFNCSMRSRWARDEQTAIKDWNNEILSKKQAIKEGRNG